MKRILSVFLMIVIILSVFSINTFAFDTRARVDSAESAQRFRDFIEQYTDDKTGETVVKLYLCSHKTDTWPHTWVYFENVSDSTVYVGPYELRAGEGVSSGSFGLSVEDGAGVYYNLETYRKTYCAENADLAYIMTELNEAELAEVSHFIANHNCWSFSFFNCCYYAIGCWNAGGGVYIYPAMVFPSLAREFILMYNPVTDASFVQKEPDASEVYRLMGKGDSAYLQQVKTETLGA